MGRAGGTGLAVLAALALLAAVAVLVSFRSAQQPVAMLENPRSVSHNKGKTLGDSLSEQLRWDLAHALREDVASQLPTFRLKFGKDSVVAKGVASLIQTQTSPGKDHLFEDDLFKNDPDLAFPPGLEPDEMDDEFAGQTTGKEAISCAASKKDYEDRLKAGLVDDDEKTLHSMFASVDSDKSGCITASEIYKLAVHQKQQMTYEECQETPTCGMSAADSKLAVQAMDRDGSGKIDFNEFKEYIVLKAVFDTFDKDGSGYLSADELCAALQLVGKSWSEDECKLAVLLAADSDGDGKVSFKEFREILSTAPASTGSAGLF